MNKLITTFCLLSSALFGEIFEIHNVREITNYLKDEMLVIFDLDNTVIEPSQELGNDQWFNHRLSQHISRGLPFQKALRKTVDELYAIYHITSVRLVEEEIVDVMNQLQQQYPVIALTTRGCPAVHCTLDHLQSVGIDFSITAPQGNIVLIEHPHFFDHPAVYQEGIIFSSGNKKGITLGSWIEKMNFQPKTILFIDDKIHHLVCVEQYCQNQGIEFIGLRYGFLDEKVESFHPAVSEQQWESFANIPSDEQVRSQ